MILGAGLTVPGRPETGERPALALDYAVPACQRALERARCRADEIDLIIGKGTSPSHVAVDPAIIGPRIAHPLQRALGATRAFVFDLLDSDWCFALAVAEGFLRSHGLRRILLVHAEASRHGVSPCAESGFTVADGAGAIVVGPGHGRTVSVPLPPIGGRAFAPARIELEAVPEPGRIPARFVFPGQPGLDDSRRQACLRALARLGDAPTPDPLVSEAWFDDEPVIAGVETTPSVGRLCGLTVAAALARSEGSACRSLRLLTFDPFKLRVSAARLHLGVA